MKRQRNWKARTLPPHSSVQHPSDATDREPELRGELAVRRFRIGILEIVKLEQLEVDHFATRLATGPEPL